MLVSDIACGLARIRRRMHAGLPATSGPAT
jgi:hypothetical protein